MRCYGEIEDVENRNRLRLCLFAYAYEFLGNSLISDSEYDDLSYTINPFINTDSNYDNFWLTEFNAFTSMWIRKHPNIKGIKDIYDNRI